MQNPKVRMRYVFEAITCFGLLCLWVSYLSLTVHIYQHASKNRVSTAYAMEIPMFSRLAFFAGDIFFAFGGTLYLFRLKDDVSESTKLRWSALFVGLIISAHLPIIIRAWILRTTDFYTGAETDSSKLAWPLISTSIATAIAFVVTIVSGISVDPFPTLESGRFKYVSRGLVMAAIVFGEIFFIAGIIEYELRETLYSSIVFLVLSFACGVAGYVPARYVALTRDDIDDEEIPLMR